jgi:hypothetical protein
MAENKQPTHVTVAGTGTVWVAPEGTAIPADLADPPDPWLDIGYTSDDGVTITMSRDQEDINAWQSTDPVRVLVTAEPKTVEMELLEFDRESIMLAYRGGTWAGSAAPYTYTPPVPGASDVRAMLIDAVDGGFQFRFVFPRVQIQGDVETTLARTDAVRLPLELAVLASTPSWSIVGDLPGFGATTVMTQGYDDMTVAELQAELEARGLPTSGTKAELVERLKAELVERLTSADRGVPAGTAA